MKKFLDENFLLHSKTAEYLYHEHAAKLPIIDYHCHLSPALIAENKKFENITQPWLYGDHYKWRAMRTNGVDERFCSGNASDREKFDKWAETVPYTYRNPLYHWTHLELQRYFGITQLLNPETAGSIYSKTAEMLKGDDYSPVGMIRMMNVEIVCTTDDPVDSLEHHRIIKEKHPAVKIIPAWRPDKLLGIEDPAGFNAYVDKLAAVSGISINNYESLNEALDMRHQFFHNEGCRLSDHGLETFYAEPYTPGEINAIFNKVRSGSVPTAIEVLKFRSAYLHDQAVMDHKRNWTQQYHVGALRNNNSRMLRTYGPDGGFDSIGDFTL
ncbi:MAG: glucuronate isomerase, partial [Bacteroidales bacterium]